jgi:hypothetical protein
VRGFGCIWLKIILEHQQSELGSIWGKKLIGSSGLIFAGHRGTLGNHYQKLTLLQRFGFSIRIKFSYYNH